MEPALNEENDLTEEAIARAEAERRQRQRLNLPIAVKFLIDGNEEAEGQIVDISANGTLVESGTKPELASKIICHFERIGCYEGVVNRITDVGFAVQFGSRASTQERLVERLMQAATIGVEDASDQRRHLRVTVDRETTLEYESGRKKKCVITDMSVSGLAVETIERPALHTKVRVGQMEGRVVRHTENGFAIEFLGLNPNVQSRTLSQSIFQQS